MYRLILYGGTCVSEDEDENGEPLPYRYVDSESIDTLEELARGFVGAPGRRVVVVELTQNAKPITGWITQWEEWWHEYN